jgi:hypothetical protein
MAGGEPRRARGVWVNLLDDERALQLTTPRKAKSGWTRRNRERVAALESQGRRFVGGLQHRDSPPS